MKKLLPILLALTMLCALPMSALMAEEPTTITYAYFSAGESQEATFREMIAIFEAKNPDIKIDAKPTGYGEHFTQLATQIAANNAPDCFELNMENFLAFVVRGAVSEVGSLFEKTGLDPSVYSQGVLDACSMNGTLYAIPQSYSTVVLAYNKDLFDQAGIEYPAIEWTWDDELAAAEAITALGIEDTYGMFQEIQYWEFYKTIQCVGGSLLNEDGTAFTLNSPENVKTLQYMVDRVREHHVMPSREDLAGRGNMDMFIEGKLGMLRCGIWGFNDFAKRIDSFAWDIQVEPGMDKKATHFFANVGCISRDSDKQDASFRFLNAMASDPDVVRLRLNAQWELPVVADEEMMAEYLKVTPPDNKIAVLQSMDYAVVPPALEEFSYAVEVVNPWLEGIDMGDMTAQEVLDACQEELEGLDLIK